ncbi:MAG: hypothetical protein ACREAR_01240 [Nitrosotalea sp.]
MGLFIFIILGITGVMAYTTSYLTSHTTIWLEFKRGCKILHTEGSFHVNTTGYLRD